MLIKRFFIEKKDGLGEDKRLIAELNAAGVSGISGARVFHRYDIEGVSDTHLQTAKHTVISNPAVDILYEEELPPFDAGWRVFAKEYLPGQFDQYEESLRESLELISGEKAANVAYAKVYALKGDISDAAFKTITSCVLNTVDARLASMDKPKTLAMETQEPPDIETLGLIGRTDAEALKLRGELGLAMSTEDMLLVRDYFKNDEGREPTYTEIRVIDTYWSDHCRHSTFLTELTDIEIENGYYAEPIRKAYDAYIAEKNGLGRDERPVTLMDIATTGMRALKAKGYLNDLDESDEVNACSIEIDVDVDGKTEKWLLMFKNETHNHPTEIEPFGGASTCLGGGIRDPLSGRSYVYQAMRITGAGDPRTPFDKTLPGKLPQKRLTLEAAAGYSSYGNQIGLTSGHVREIYDDGFVAKRMECGALVAAAPKEHVVREKPVKGDFVMMVGGRTGRDGCGGATGSSREQTEESAAKSGAEVQKGNPPLERNIVRLFLDGEAAHLIKKCNDFGAGGVSVAIGELADSLRIDLDTVLTKYPGLDGTELAISESQERMACVVSAANAEKFIALADRENLECVSVAEVTDDGYMRIFWRGKQIVGLKRSFLDTNGVRQRAKAVIECPSVAGVSGTGDYNGNFKETLINTLKDLNSCSQKGLVERFDATTGAATVLMPFGGEEQLTPEDVMAAKIPVSAFEPLSGRDTETVSVMSAAYSPSAFRESPFHGGVYAVVESVARLVAAGCDYKRVRLSFQEFFERMSSPQAWGKTTAALLGALSAQMGLKTPSIGGKDSMSGTFGELNVPPTLASFAVSATGAEKVKSAAMTGNGGVYIITPKYDEYGMPDFVLLSAQYEWLFGFNGNIAASAAVKKHGAAEVVAKMCFGNGAGITFAPEFIEKYGEKSLFAPLYGAVVFEAGSAVSAEDMEKYNIAMLGTADKSGKIVLGGVEISVAELVAEWEKPLEEIFPTKTGGEKTVAPEIKTHTAFAHKKATKAVKPRVVIPIFPGTSTELDFARAFALAGADVETVIFRNVKEEYIKESIEKVAQAISRAQIIMLPGGFDAENEPYGASGFIAAALRSPRIAEALNEHIKNSDGLILGVAGGFQALIRTGLLPYGEFRDIADNSPTLYFNEIGRHVSQIADIKIVSNDSPFLCAYKPGETYRIAVSFGEGRFLVDEQGFSSLSENGRIASVFVDGNGAPTLSRPFNPGGGMYAVEGLLSPEGRIFGRLGHSERAGRHVFKNVPGEYDMNIFKSSVEYYKL